ncbi:MAG TPA: CaiB/BaiF CoA-transferase family protein, partial [Candidatus Limnocylindrales bacterium]|nr:CaiB/BaiF CoA-transferase family protein [Candidatus Limnocylindrales bacterium]
MTTDGPLAGLLVVDLSRVLAGPFCTRILADLGARVVKVERPRTGDDSRSYGPFVDGHSLYFARVNRGKESIALDLKSADGRTVLDALLERADVLVENFRPGVMERLGYGPASLTARFPRLVALSLSGFGQTGPWSDRPAYDAVIQGMAGVLSITGAPGGDPVKPGVPVADHSAGLYGAVAV